MQKHFRKAIVIVGALALDAHAMASSCYDIAIQRYNKSRVSLVAPYNYAQVVSTGKAPVNCTINSLFLGEYSIRISCSDGYKYEIGTTDYCGPGGGPNCEKAIVTTPSGQKSFRSTVELGDEKTCTAKGAQLEISSKVFLDNKDILIITTHQFRK